MNLIPWCNLFSNASKYSICVRASRYRVILYAGITAAILLLLLIFFSYAYHLALAIAVITFVLLGLLLVKQTSQQAVVARFVLSCEGVCSFNGKNDYQLQKNSRLSFLGCWLILQPISSVGANAKGHDANSLFFIYRDSLTQQDFSRIAHVISQLNSQ